MYKSTLFGMNNESKPLIVMYMHKIPYPPDTGTNQRIYSMVNFLKNNYKVGLVIPEYSPDIHLLQNIFDYVWYGGNYQHTLGRLHKYFFRQFYTILFQFGFNKHLSKFKNNPLGRYNVFAAMTLYRICLLKKPSLIIVQKVINTVLAIAIARKFNIPVINDTHDLYKLRNDNLTVILKQLATTTIEDEINLLKLYDGLIAIQFQEAKILEDYFPNKKVITALHPAEYISKNENIAHIFNKNPILLFVGSSSEHNKEALNYFINTHFGLIKKKYPTIKLIICGTVSSSLSSTSPNIEILGRVKNLQPFYQNATLIINPVLHGSGLKIKTIDALAYGKCLVTTPIGSEGLVDVEKALIAVEPKNLGEKIIELLQDRSIIQIYEKSAHDYANKYLTSEVCYAELTLLIKELLEAKD